MNSLSSKEKDNAVNEVRILASIKFPSCLFRSHPNIIAYKEAFIDDKTGCLHIVMEFAEGGDLLRRVERHKKCGTAFTESELVSTFAQMVVGLKALHDRKILHRDIKVRSPLPVVGQRLPV